MILTSHADMPESGTSTGVWLSSFTDAYYEFSTKGFEITIASPEGGRPPIDPLSMTAEYATSTIAHFNEDPVAQSEFGNTWKLKEIDSSDYDAVYIADGHGALWDMAYNKTLGRLLSRSLLMEKPIASVGHGVAALISLSALRPGLVSGRRTTGFTDTEEALLKRHHHVPFDLKAWLKQEGADFRYAIIPFSPHVESDGLLITGQNPMSARKVAQTLVQECYNEMVC